MQAMALGARQQDEIKKNVMAAFEEALDRIDSYQRRPSRWEEDCLVRALAAMTCGAFIKAAGELLELRDSHPGIDKARDVSRPARAYPLTTQWLREGLANLRALD